MFSKFSTAFYFANFRCISGHFFRLVNRNFLFDTVAKIFATAVAATTARFLPVILTET